MRRRCRTSRIIDVSNRAADQSKQKHRSETERPKTHSPCRGKSGAAVFVRLKRLVARADHCQPPADRSFNAQLLDSLAGFIQSRPSPLPLVLQSLRIHVFLSPRRGVLLFLFPHLPPFLFPALPLLARHFVGCWR